MRGPIRPARQTRQITKVSETAPKRFSFEGDLGFRVRQMLFHWPYHSVFQRMRMFHDIMLFVKTDDDLRTVRQDGQKGANPGLKLALTKSYIDNFETKYYGSDYPEEWCVQGPNEMYVTVYSTIGLLSLAEISLNVNVEAITNIKVRGWVRHPFTCEYFAERHDEKLTNCKIFNKKNEQHPPISCSTCKHKDSLIPDSDVYIRACDSSRYYRYLHELEKEIAIPFNKVMTEIYKFLRQTKITIEPAQGDIGHYEELARDEGKLEEATPFDKKWGIEKFDNLEEQG